MIKKMVLGFIIVSALACSVYTYAQYNSEILGVKQLSPSSGKKDGSRLFQQASGGDTSQEVKKVKEEDTVPKYEGNDKAVKDFNAAVKKSEDIDNYKKLNGDKFERIKKYYSEKEKEHGNKSHLVKATITFENTLSENQLKDFIAKYKLDIESFDLSYDENGLDGTKNLVWANKFENVENTFKQKMSGKKVNVQGISAIYSKVDLKDLDLISKEKNVFVDISSDVVFTNMQDAEYVPSIYKHVKDKNKK